ncbi:MAG TPA: metal ABC transporter permease [bacterium]|nr:metal ABC transporter permease [bacterium]
MRYRFTFYSAVTILLLAIGWALDPLETRHFFQDWVLWHEPILGGVICGVLAAVLGMYMLLNRIVFISLAVSQGAGLGIFAAFFIAGLFGASLAGSPLALLSGFLFASLAALLFTSARRTAATTDESLIGLIYCAASGLIVFIGDRISEGRHDIENLLFGSAVAVTRSDLILLGAIAALAVSLHSLFRREFLYVSADPGFMAIRGFRTAFWKILLYFTLTLGITVSMRTLGSLPVFALMVVPPWIALRNARGLKDSFATAVLVGAVLPPLGYYLSFLYSFPTGASLIVVALIYVLAAIFEKKVFIRRTGGSPAPGPG